MNENNLVQAIDDCDQGIVPFNLGVNRAFLFNKKWYPLRAIVNYANQLSENKAELTTDRALVALVYLGRYVRIEDIAFENNFPVPLINEEIINEANKISILLEGLTKPL